MTITIAPGIPKTPTNIEVIKFKPIWKLKNEPIRLIKNIVKPPKIELITNFNIIFIGTTNNLPNINKKKIQAIYVMILLKSNFTTCPFLIILLYIQFYAENYTTWFSSKFKNCNFSILLNSIPFFLDFFIK